MSDIHPAPQTFYAGDLLADLHKHDARHQTTTNQTPPFSLYGLAAARIEALETALREEAMDYYDTQPLGGKVRRNYDTPEEYADAVLAEVGKQ